MSDDGTFDVVYAEDNPLWLLAYLLIAGALLVVVAVLGAFYLAGLWAARRIEPVGRGAVSGSAALMPLRPASGAGSNPRLPC